MNDFHFAIDLNFPRCNSTSYVIHGLVSGRTYQFRVRAKNVHGSSEPSCPSDPQLFQPPAAVDKAAVGKPGKTNSTSNRLKDVDINDDQQQLADRIDDYDDETAPQFEYCHVTVQPGDPNFLVIIDILNFNL